MSGRRRRVLRRDPGARGPLGRRARGGPRRCSTALIYRSNLLGSDRALANKGGGNTSPKGTIVDHAGRETRVLWVKGSGTDLATITPPGFAVPAARRAAAAARTGGDGRRGDGRLPAPLRAVSPDQPRPSIETLLHAFVPAAARRPHASRRGDRAHLVARRAPARRGGVRRRGGLARLPAARASTCRAGSRELLEENPAARAVLLAKHGLVTWGETGEESYARHDRVRRARRRRRSTGRGRGRFGLGGPKVAELGGRRAPTLLARRRCRRSAARCSRTRTASCSRSTAARRRSRSPRPRARPR